jgi:integrase
MDRQRKAHESRGLKHRANEEVRPVPACPELVAHIKRHAAEYGTAPDGRLLRGIRGERLSEVTVGRAWRRARKAALSTREAASALAKRPYDLRHAAVSTWLNAGCNRPWLPSGPATASKSCCASTRSASRARTPKAARLIESALTEPTLVEARDDEADEGGNHADESN